MQGRELADYVKELEAERLGQVKPVVTSIRPNWLALELEAQFQIQKRPKESRLKFLYRWKKRQSV